jgi:hypothetical protein
MFLPQGQNASLKEASNSHYGLGHTSFLHFVAHFQGRWADKVGDEVEDKVVPCALAVL